MVKREIIIDNHKKFQGSFQMILFHSHVRKFGARTFDQLVFSSNDTTFEVRRFVW